MVAPTLQQYQNQEGYKVQKNPDGTTTVTAEAREYTKRKSGRDRDRATYVPEKYTFDENGRIISGERVAIRTRYQRNNRYGQEPYVRERFKREGPGYAVYSYETVSKKNGGESVKFQEKEVFTYDSTQRVSRQARTNLSPTQLSNRRYDEFQSIARDAGVGRFTRSQYNQLTARDIRAIEQRAEQNRQAQEAQKAQFVTRPQGFTQEQARNVVAVRLFEKQGKIAAFDQEGNAVIVAPVGSKIDTRAAASTLNRRRSSPDQGPITPDDKNRFGASTISEAEKRGPISKFEESAKTFIDRKSGTTGGLLAGTAFGVYRASKGVAEGFIALFRPSTYKNLYTSVTNPKQTIEALGTLGAELKQDPGKILEIGGEMYGFGQAVGGVQKVAKTINKPTVIGKELSVADTEQLIEGGAALTVARSQTAVKVGGRTYQVISAGKELALKVDRAGLQATVSKIKSQAPNVQLSEYAVGVRLLQKQGSVGIEQGAVVASRGGKILVGSRRTQAVTNEIGNVQGLKVEAGVAITQRSKLAKTSKSALVKGEVPKGALKQTQSELSGSLSKEILAVDNLRRSLAFTLQIKGKAALKAIRAAIDKRLKIVGPGRKVRSEGISGPLGGSTAQATGKAQVTGTENILLQNIEGSAKQAAKQAYLNEPTVKIPGIRPQAQAVTELEVEKAQEQKIKQEAAQKKETAQKVKIVSAVDVKTVQESKQAAKSKSSSKSSTTFDIVQIQEKAQSQQPAQKVRQEQIQEQVQKQEQQPKTQLANSTFTSTKIDVLSRPLIVPKRADEKKGGPVDLFTTFVRRRGKFQAVGSFADPEEAIRTGANIVQSTAAASFKVQGRGGAIQNAFKNLNKATFRRSKKEQGVIIEKVRSRINTPGELGEITFKGIATQRSGKKGGKNPVVAIFGGA